MLIDLLSVDAITKNMLRKLRLRYVKDLIALERAELAWFIGDKRVKALANILAQKGYRFYGELSAEQMRTVVETFQPPLEAFREGRQSNKPHVENPKKNSDKLPYHMKPDGQPDFQAIAMKGEKPKQPAVHFALADKGAGFQVLCFETLVPNGTFHPEKVTCKRCLSAMTAYPEGQG